MGLLIERSLRGRFVSKADFHIGRSLGCFKSRGRLVWALHLIGVGLLGRCARLRWVECWAILKYGVCAGNGERLLPFRGSPFKVYGFYHDAQLWSALFCFFLGVSIRQTTRPAQYVGLGPSLFAEWSVLFESKHKFDHLPIRKALPQADLAPGVRGGGAPRASKLRTPSFESLKAWKLE